MTGQSQSRILRKIFRGLTVFFMALTILYGAISFTVYGNDEGVQWFMWRDQPWIAGILLGFSLISGILWFVTSRISRKLEKK